MDSKRTMQKVEQLTKLKEKNKLSFDLTIQRKDNIWDTKRKSMLIHSVLVGYPVPSVFAKREENIYHILDGKQRLTSLIDYHEDHYALSKNIAEVDGVDVSGKKFSELPEVLQQKIANYSISVEYVEEINQAQMEELFFRLNNGVPLRKIEITRAVLGGKELKFVESIATMAFFADRVNLSPSARQRFVDQEMILQILAMIQNEDTGFSSKEIDDFVTRLRDVEMREGLKAKLESACYYLGETFTRKTKYLKKLHVPMLFKLVLDMQDSGQLIPKPAFAEWTDHFFSNLPEDYSIACSSGSAKKENVQKRLAIMTQAFHAYFDIKNRVQELVAEDEIGTGEEAM